LLSSTRLLFCRISSHSSSSMRYPGVTEAGMESKFAVVTGAASEVMRRETMSKPLRTTSCACVSLRRASRSISHLYDLVLAPAGLKASQFMLLQAINESEEIAHCDLARDYAASVETLSRRLASARKSGLVRVQTGERQRRIYRLTPKGTRLLEAALPYWEMAQFRLHKTLGDADWQLLSGFAERLAMAAIRAEYASTAKSRANSQAEINA